MQVSALGHGNAYRIADLEHGPRGSSLISAHNVLHHDIPSLFFRPQYRPPHYGGELVFGEVLW